MVNRNCVAQSCGLFCLETRNTIILLIIRKLNLHVIINWSISIHLLKYLQRGHDPQKLNFVYHTWLATHMHVSTPPRHDPCWQSRKWKDQDCFLSECRRLQEKKLLCIYKYELLVETLNLGRQTFPLFEPSDCFFKSRN